MKALRHALGTRFRLLQEVLYSWRQGWLGCYVPRGGANAAEAMFPCQWSSFSTVIRHRETIGVQNANRVHNIELAAASLHGLIIPPGQIFSMFRIVGEAKKSTGYLPGPMIAGTQLTESYGGGLCQVSTTLFNAALLANCDILEKHNHSVDVWGEDRFVELGRDAAYVYARKDLKFRNNTDSPIRLTALVDRASRKFTCSISAMKPLSCRVLIDSEVLESPSGGGGGCWDVRTTRTCINSVGRECTTFVARESYLPGNLESL